MSRCAASGRGKVAEGEKKNKTKKKGGGNRGEEALKLLGASGVSAQR